MTISTLDRVARYRSWLRREPTDRPLIGLLWEPDIPPLPDFIARVGLGQCVTLDDVDPTIFLPAIESWYALDRALCSDVIQPFTPAFGIPWVEAIAGSPILVHPGTLWAGPCLDDYADRPPIKFDPGNPWLRKLIEFTEALVATSNGRFPVALPQMRGPLDVLAALRTSEGMALDLIERPEAVRTVLGELTDLWIGIAEAVLEVIPPFAGGYCTRMKMWAPGRAVTPQNDASSLISPQMYEEYLLPLDRRIVSRFPYHSFHLHSTEHHQIDGLLTLENLTAIQLTLEHTLGGPSLEVTLPAAARVLQSKPLLLVALDVETAETCLAELPSAGLCLTIGWNGYEIPAEYAQWIESWCHS